MRARSTISTGLLAAAASIALLAGGGGAAPAAVTDTTCPETLTLFAGGTRSPINIPFLYRQDVLNIPQVDRYKEIEGSEWEYVDYEASILPFWGWRLWMDDSVRQGSSAVQMRIYEQEAKCGAGKTQYVLVGYSQGGEVIGDVADYFVDVDPGFAKNNLNVYLYSDPQRPGGVSDVAKRFNVSILGRIVFQGPRTTTEADYRNYQSFCVSEGSLPDGVCQMAKPFTPFWLLRSLFGYFGHHGDYKKEGSKWDVPVDYTPPPKPVDPPVNEEPPVDPPVDEEVPDDPVEDEPVTVPVIDLPEDKEEADPVVSVLPVADDEPMVEEEPAITDPVAEEGVIIEDLEGEALPQNELHE